LSEIGGTNALFLARRAAPLEFELNLKPRVFAPLLALGLALYVWLAVGSWQATLAQPWLRMGVAWLLFLIPGWVTQQLLWQGRDVTFSQRLAVSFGAAVGLGATFGLIATAVHGALWFVVGALLFVTCGGALILAAREKWQWQRRWRLQISRASWFMLAPLGLACLIAVRLTYGLMFAADDLTYDTYVTHWLEAAHFDWLQLPLDVARVSPSRFWLAYWTLNQALLAKWSALHVIELTRLYLAPGLALGALLATYALARAFGMTRLASGFALTLQVAALLLLTAVDQAGTIFFNRLVEDKVVAAFLLIPIFVIAVTAFLKQPARGSGALILLLGLGLALTHPTLMAVAVVAVALFTLFSTLPARAWRSLGVVMFVLAVMLSAPLAMRLFDTTYTTKIPFAAETLQRKDQVRRVLEWGWSLYSLHPKLYWGLPFLWTLAAAGAALFEFKTSYAARWILATALLFVSVINPLTTWLWGFAIGSSQGWRILWCIPFGIAAAYLASFLGRRVVPARWKKESVIRVACAVGGTAILLGALFWVWRGANALETFKPVRPAKQEQSARLLALKPMLEAQLTEPTVVVGGNRWLSDRLPAISAKVRVFSFRTARSMWKLNDLELQDAQARVSARRKLEAAKTSAAERLAILEKYKARFIVSESGTAWVRDIVAAAPERIQYVGASDTLELYRVQP